MLFYTGKITKPQNGLHNCSKKNGNVTHWNSLVVYDRNLVKVKVHTVH